MIPFEMLPQWRFLRSAHRAVRAASRKEPKLNGCFLCREMAMPLLKKVYLGLIAIGLSSCYLHTYN